jgi:putative tryptophan/tyrosine transport system substrate-binding protein
VRRRDLLTMLGGAAAMWHRGVRAQPTALPVIGVVSATSPADFSVAFGQGLGEAGFVDGKNVTIELHSAGGHPERLAAIAADLVSRRVAVLVVAGGADAVLAAKSATATIPIVFRTGADPVKTGIVASFGRPGGNVTGVSFITAELNRKRMELLQELVPKATVIALLVNSDNTIAESVASEVQEAARARGLKVHVLRARTEQDIDAALASLVPLRAGALLVASDAFFNFRREQIVALAARHAVPASFDVREFVTAGGLMSYGPSLSEVWRQTGIYAGKILKGAKPADLPVLQPTRFELVINRKTAKTLGLTIPQSLLLRADEVVQ